MKIQEICNKHPDSFDGFFKLLPESIGTCLLTCYKVPLEELAKKYDICKAIVDRCKKKQGKYRFFLPDIALICKKPIVQVESFLKELQKNP